MVKLPNAYLADFSVFAPFCAPKRHKRKTDTKVPHCLNKFSA